MHLVAFETSGELPGLHVSGISSRHVRQTQISRLLFGSNVADVCSVVGFFKKHVFSDLSIRAAV